MNVDNSNDTFTIAAATTTTTITATVRVNNEEEGNDKHCVESGADVVVVLVKKKDTDKQNINSNNDNGYADWKKGNWCWLSPLPLPANSSINAATFRSPSSIDNALHVKEEEKEIEIGNPRDGGRTRTTSRDDGSTSRSTRDGVCVQHQTKKEKKEGNEQHKHNHDDCSDWKKGNWRWLSPAKNNDHANDNEENNTQRSIRKQNIDTPSNSSSRQSDKNNDDEDDSDEVGRNKRKEPSDDDDDGDDLFKKKRRLVPCAASSSTVSLPSSLSSAVHSNHTNNPNGGGGGGGVDKGYESWTEGSWCWLLPKNNPAASKNKTTRIMRVRHHRRTQTTKNTPYQERIHVGRDTLDRSLPILTGPSSLSNSKKGQKKKGVATDTTTKERRALVIRGAVEVSSPSLSSSSGGKRTNITSSSSSSSSKRLKIATNHTLTPLIAAPTTTTSISKCNANLNPVQLRLLASSSSSTTEKKKKQRKGKKDKTTTNITTSSTTKNASTTTQTNSPTTTITATTISSSPSKKTKPSNKIRPDLIVATISNSSRPLIPLVAEPPTSLGQVQLPYEEFEDDLRLNLGTSNGEYYQRIDIDNGNNNDGQIMVRTKTKKKAPSKPSSPRISKNIVWNKIESVVIKSQVHKDKAKGYLSDYLLLNRPKHFAQISTIIQTQPNVKPFKIKDIIIQQQMNAEISTQQVLEVDSHQKQNAASSKLFNHINYSKKEAQRNGIYTTKETVRHRRCSSTNSNALATAAAGATTTATTAKTEKIKIKDKDNDNDNTGKYLPITSTSLNLVKIDNKNKGSSSSLSGTHTSTRRNLHSLFSRTSTSTSTTMGEGTPLRAQAICSSINKKKRSTANSLKPVPSSSTMVVVALQKSEDSSTKKDFEVIDLLSDSSSDENDTDIECSICHHSDGPNTTKHDIDNRDKSTVDAVEVKRKLKEGTCVPHLKKFHTQINNDSSNSQVSLMIASSTDMVVKKGGSKDYTTTLNTCATSIPVSTKATSSVRYDNNNNNIKSQNNNQNSKQRVVVADNITIKKKITKEQHIYDQKSRVSSLKRCNEKDIIDLFDSDSDSDLGLTDDNNKDQVNDNTNGSTINDTKGKTVQPITTIAIETVCNQKLELGKSVFKAPKPSERRSTRNQQLRLKRDCRLQEGSLDITHHLFLEPTMKKQKKKNQQPAKLNSTSINKSIISNNSSSTASGNNNNIDWDRNSSLNQNKKVLVQLESTNIITATTINITKNNSIGSAITNTSITKEKQQQLQLWKCPQCTLVNPKTDLTCNACHHRMPRTNTGKCYGSLDGKSRYSSHSHDVEEKEEEGMFNERQNQPSPTLLITQEASSKEEDAIQSDDSNGKQDDSDVEFCDSILDRSEKKNCNVDKKQRLSGHNIYSDNNNDKFNNNDNDNDSHVDSSEKEKKNKNIKKYPKRKKKKDQNLKINVDGSEIGSCSYGDGNVNFGTDDKFSPNNTTGKPHSSIMLHPELQLAEGMVKQIYGSQEECRSILCEGIPIKDCHYGCSSTGDTRMKDVVVVTTESGKLLSKTPTNGDDADNDDDDDNNNHGIRFGGWDDNGDDKEEEVDDDDTVEQPLRKRKIAPGITSLSFTIDDFQGRSNCGGWELPEEIFQFGDTLQELSLTNCKKVPDNIRQRMKVLRTIRLYANTTKSKNKIINTTKYGWNSNNNAMIPENIVNLYSYDNHENNNIPPPKLILYGFKTIPRELVKFQHHVTLIGGASVCLY